MKIFHVAALALAAGAFSMAAWLGAPRAAEARLCITGSESQMKCVIPPVIVINAPGSAYLGPGWYVMTDQITGAAARVNADGSITLYPTHSVRFGSGQLEVPWSYALPPAGMDQAVAYEPLSAFAHPGPGVDISGLGQPWHHSPYVQPGQVLPPVDLQPIFTNGPTDWGSPSRNPRINLVRALQDAGYRLAPNQVRWLQQQAGKYMPGRAYITVTLRLNKVTGVWEGVRWDWLFAVNLDLIKAGMPKPQWCTTSAWIMDVPTTVQPGQSFTPLGGLTDPSGNPAAGGRIVFERVPGTYLARVDATGLSFYERKTATTGRDGAAAVTFTLPKGAATGTFESIVAYPDGHPECAAGAAFGVGTAPNGPGGPGNPGPGGPGGGGGNGQPGNGGGGGGLPPDCDLNDPAIWQKVLTDPTYFQIHCVRPQLIR